MFHADLHIHSRFSRACAKDCDIEHLAWWALRKGLRVLGTGDFTHPAWAAELRETLVPAEPGLFRVRPELEKRVLRDSPATCAGTVRFMLSVDNDSTSVNRGGHSPGDRRGAAPLPLSTNRVTRVPVLPTGHGAVPTAGRRP